MCINKRSALVKTMDALKSGFEGTLEPYIVISENFMYADAAFTVAAPKYWNSLPDELRTMSSFITFKRRLHTYMVSL